MADADSLHEVISDYDLDSSAVDGDVEEDDTSAHSIEASLRKKSKRKKRKTKNFERSSGDSDGQLVNDKKERGGGAGEDGSDSSSSEGEEADDEAALTEEGTLKLTPKGETEKTENLAQAIRNLNLHVKNGESQQIHPQLPIPLTTQTAPKSIEEAQRKKFEFWDTQPVPKMNEKVSVNAPIEADKSVSAIRKEPYSLPPGFRWDIVDIQDPIQLKMLYTLLNENYVEDDDNMFRFDYSPEFFQWALKPPGWLKEWHCGVRVTKTDKLVGFISAVPAHITVHNKTIKMVEINFLCVHKKLRAKRVAPVLIKEITRRVNCTGIFQAVYTAGVVLPKPVATCRYWHRSLNPRKLIDVKFSNLTRNMTMQRTLKLYKLPDVTQVEGFRPLKSKDAAEVHKLLSNYLTAFDMAPSFSFDEFKHWFLPRNGIIDSFVVEKNGKITDFVSFYTLPSTVMHHPTHKQLKAAYSFYNVSTETPWVELINDALIVAKNMGFDVFNALDLMDNKQFLKKLKFGIGDGNLQYYLYNWRCPNMVPEKVGLVLQ